MSVELRIVRLGGSISLDEWQRLVSSRHDLKIQTDNLVSDEILPETGKPLVLPPDPGQALMLVGGSWLPAFRGFKGQVIFKPLPETDPVAKDLAHALAAEILDEDDPRTLHTFPKRQPILADGASRDTDTSRALPVGLALVVALGALAFAVVRRSKHTH